VERNEPTLDQLVDHELARVGWHLSIDGGAHALFAPLTCADGERSLPDNDSWAELI
jgi:hypothetical protein